MVSFSPNSRSVQAISRLPPPFSLCAVSLTLVMAGMVVRWGTTMEAIENASCNCPREHLTFIADPPRCWPECTLKGVWNEEYYIENRLSSKEQGDGKKPKEIRRSTRF